MYSERYDVKARNCVCCAGTVRPPPRRCSLPFAARQTRRDLWCRRQGALPTCDSSPTPPAQRPASSSTGRSQVLHHPASRQAHLCGTSWDRMPRGGGKQVSSGRDLTQMFAAKARFSCPFLSLVFAFATFAVSPSTTTTTKPPPDESGKKTISTWVFPRAFAWRHIRTTRAREPGHQSVWRFRMHFDDLM